MTIHCVHCDILHFTLFIESDSFCDQNPENNCGGITVPCDRSCGKSGMAMFTDLFGAIEYHDVHHVLLVLCSLLVTLSWTLCIINLCVSMRQRRKASYAMVKQVDSEHEI